MKYIFLLLLFVAVSVIAEDLAVEPDRPAPYGLTWSQYWLIKAEGSKEADISNEQFWELLYTAENREMAITLGKAMRLDESSPQPPVDEEQRESFCEAREDQTINASELWAAYPAITQRDLTLAYLDESIEFGREWVTTLYPEVWMTVTGFVYCSKFYEGIYRSR